MRDTISWPAVLRQIKLTQPVQLSEPSDDRLGSLGVLGGVIPPTYAEFTRRFGAGQLSGQCEFFSSSPDVSPDWDIFYWNLNHLRFVIESGSEADPRASHMTIFGRFWSGEDYGWLRQEVTQKVDGKPVEYAIYSVSRFMDSTIKLADTFPEFIERFCMGDGLLKHLGFDQSNEPFQHDRHEFVPYQ